jgi:hypothetical protein
MSNIRTIPSSWINLHTKLDQFTTVLRAHNYLVGDPFQPGLSRAEITDLARTLPFKLPEEVYQLYTWRNGTKADIDLSLFGDHIFIPLEQAIQESRDIEQYYEITKVLPFASFQGSWLVLPAEPYAADIDLWPPLSDTIQAERPIIHIFEGVAVFAYSLETMLDMIMAWFTQGVAELDTLYAQDVRQRIQEQYNPGLLDIPEYVFMPAPEFRQTVTIQASTTTALVNQPVTLYATRATGPWVKVRFVDVPLGTCWWKTAPPSPEDEVAANLSWDVSPPGIARFDVGTQMDGTRQVVFAQPGIYRLKGHSAVWCPPGSGSNTIEIRIEPI